MRHPTAAAALLAAAILVACPAARAGNDPSGVVLLVNGDNPDSVSVGAHFAAKRHLPGKQVVRLRVPAKQELDLEEYRATVEDPLRAHLFREGLEERARCLVLTRGIPVRVRFREGGYVSTAALLQAMDLPFAGVPQGGSIPGAPVDQLRPEQRANPWRDGPFPEDRRPGGAALRLVTSLDGWTAGDAMALVDRSVAADVAPPADPLFLFQDAGGGAAGRNRDYPAGLEALRQAGFRAEALPQGADRVKERRDLMGWMSGGAYSGLDDGGVLSNAFAPGALVDMLESFGAVPGNFDEKGSRSQFPVPVMVRAGASGVHGAVAEPYAHTFPDVRLFHRYVQGFDLAESFHASLPYLYWMNLVLGDPLCAPFARRPRVALAGLPDRVTAPGALKVSVTAAAAESGEAPEEIALFVDGDPVGTAKGSSLEMRIDPALLPDGERLFLAVARCGGPTRTRGWAARTVSVDLPRARVVRWDPARETLAADPAGPFSAVWSGREAPRSPALSLLDDAGQPVPGTAAADPARRRLLFTPREPLAPGRNYEMRAQGFGDPAPSSFFVAGPRTLEVRGPAEVAAGESAVVTVAAAGAEKAPRHPLAGERLEFRLADPAVLVSLRDLPGDMEGQAECSVVLRKAGKAEVRVLARRSGAAASLPVLVKPAAPASLFLRIASATPVGEPFDVEVRVRDAFGNAVPDWTGTLALAAPADPRAGLPGPAEVKAGDGGRAVFRGVVFETPGHQFLVASGGGLQGADDTMAEATTLRRWFTAGPFASPGKDPFDAALVPGDDAARRPADGTVIGDRAWRYGVAGSPAAAAGKEKGAFLAVAYVSFPAETEAVLHLGHGGRMRAWFAGKAVYDGPAGPKAEAERAKVPVKAPKGPSVLVLRLEVRGEGQDDFAARIALPDGKPVPGMRVLAARPFPAETLSISGVVKDARGPVAGAEVRLSGARSLRTRTDARGWYGFADLRPGTWRVIPSVKGRKCDPESRTVELRDAEAPATDFAVK